MSKGAKGKKHEEVPLSFTERVVQFISYVNPSIQHPGRIVQARIAHIFFFVLAVAILAIDLVSGYTRRFILEPGLFDEAPSLKIIYSGWVVLLLSLILCRRGRVRTAVVSVVITSQIVELLILKLFHNPFEGYQQLFPWQILITLVCAFLVHPFAGFFVIPCTIFFLWVPLFEVNQATGALLLNPSYRDKLTSDLAILMVVAGVCLLMARNMTAAFEQLAHANEWLEKEVRLRTRDLRLAKERAEAADRAKSEFLANMSHEIRTPMTSILGYSQLLQDESLDRTERDNFIATIRKNGEHLLGLINEVLDLSKIESGKFTLQNEFCLTRRFFDEVLSSMKIPAQEKEIGLEMNLKSELPKVIYVDTLRLRQALLNLIGNAIKFTHQGNVTVDVEMREDKSDWMLHVLVSDTGIGIPKEMLETVFRPFTQVDTSFTRKYGGTGLGLTITQKIAEAMGGRLLVQSEEGKGSRFTFEVRVHKTDPAKVNRVQKDTDVARTFDGRIDGTVLLAEDGKDNQRLLTFILEKAGAQVVLAENGREAVDKLESGHFGVVLMDIQMPVMDGLQAAAEIRKRRNPIPIIAITAYAMQRDEGMCLKAGCDDFISKPVDPESLLRKVSKWMNAGRSHHAI